MSKYIVEKIKSEISLLEYANRLGIDHNKSLWRCINSKHHKNNDNHFSMSIKDNFFKCFACNAKGDIINFVMIVNNLGFNEAVILLSKELEFKCNSTNINISTSKVLDIPKIKSEDSIHLLCEYDEEYLDERLGIAECYESYPENINKLIKEIGIKRLEVNKTIFKMMFDYSMKYFNGINEKVLQYLLHERLIEENIIIKQKLFSLPPANELLNFLLKNFDNQELKGTGLLQDNGKLIVNSNYQICIPYLQNEEITYMRFRSFPINNSNRKMSKYLGLRNDSLKLNSIKRFYNLDSIYNLIPGDELYLVEGEFDTLVLQTMGFNGIGIPGVTSIPSKREFEKLLSYKINLCFDNDNAGHQLTETIKNILLNYGLNAETITFPENIKDATEFLCKYK